MKWREATNLAAACYLACLTIKPPNMQAVWAVKASEDDQREYRRWFDMAAYRVSQAGK